MDLSAFHDYDIRGIYGKQIDEKFYYALGRALAVYINDQPIAVGHDCRLSSPSLSTSLIQGICDQGVDVIALGMISTEMNYFAAGKYNYAANVIVSASHNPPEFNGAKIVRRGVIPLHGGYGLNEIKEIMQKNAYPTANKKGLVYFKNIFKEWIDHVLTFVNPKEFKNLKVVVDAGNGMGGPSWKEIMKRLTMFDFIPLYLEPDGNFPHHLADPLKDENTEDLKLAIIREKADVGVALDGDADRVFFMDELGTKLSGTITTAIFADYFLSQKKAPILYNAICGKIVADTINKNGGQAIRTKVGHSIIKEQMRKTSAIFAGEHSGHFYFGDNYNAESSLIAGLIMLQIVSKWNNKFSSLRKQYEKYYPSGEMNFVTDNSEKIINLIKDQNPKAVSIDFLDGLSVWYKDYWFNIRSSKTEPLLRLNIEAINSNQLNLIKQELLEFITSQGAQLK